MDNRERELQNAKRGFARRKFASFRSSASQNICQACGTTATRSDAHYCLVCGKVLNEDYQPLDSIRSSYRLQGKSFLVENAETEKITDLFAREENTVAHTAWACFVYSMVPYLGILFIPFTIVLGGFGVAVANKYPHLGGRKLALVSIGMSFVVLGVQIFFWWLLYIIPGIAGGQGF